MVALFINTTQFVWAASQSVVHRFGDVQPLAPGQRAAEVLLRLELVPKIPEVAKVEYASNGFIQVAHAFVLVPKGETTLRREFLLAREAVLRSFAARPQLAEVDVSVYRSRGFAGFGGPLPSLTASVPRTRLREFLHLSIRTLVQYERMWLNPDTTHARGASSFSPVLLEGVLSLYVGGETGTHQKAHSLVPEDHVSPEVRVPSNVHGGLLFGGSTAKLLAALTFDDGPHPLFTPLLLDTLKRFGVKATFFCIGRNAQAFPYFVRDMLLAGHELGNHTYHHIRLVGLSEAIIRKEIEDAAGIFARITASPVRLFRPPGGRTSQAVLRVAKSLGLTTVFWTDDPADFDHPGASVIDFRLERKLRAGAIILLHDNVLEMIQILPSFFKAAHRRGLTLAPVGSFVHA